MEDIELNNFNHQINIFIYIENVKFYKNLKQNYSNELIHLFLDNLQLEFDAQINFVFNNVTYKKIKDDFNFKRIKFILV